MITVNDLKRAVGVTCLQCDSTHVGVVDWPRQVVRCMVCGNEGNANDPNWFDHELQVEAADD